MDCKGELRALGFGSLCACLSSALALFILGAQEVCQILQWVPEGREAASVNGRVLQCPIGAGLGYHCHCMASVSFLVVNSSSSPIL
jgi:hypothetical protein